MRLVVDRRIDARKVRRRSSLLVALEPERDDVRRVGIARVAVQDQTPSPIVERPAPPAEPTRPELAVTVRPGRLLRDRDRVANIRMLTLDREIRDPIVPQRRHRGHDKLVAVIVLQRPCLQAESFDEALGDERPPTAIGVQLELDAVLCGQADIEAVIGILRRQDEAAHVNVHGEWVIRAKQRRSASTSTPPSGRTAFASSDTAPR